jgi:surface carbohydrate biosynthesis protein (TIGR04326 family)
MRVLEEAYPFFSNYVSLTVKPHPNNPLYPEDYPNLKMDITTNPLPNLLDKCDVAYTSTVTSAALDAYYSNIPVISVLEPRNLNLSPLRGLRGVYYINTAEELTSALNTVFTKQNGVFSKQDYFIDSSLIKWRRLLLAN